MTVCDAKTRMTRADAVRRPEATASNLVCMPCRDHKDRPTARDALTHPWMRGGLADRDTGKAIDRAIVQRLQVRQLRTPPVKPSQERPVLSKP